MVHKKQQVIEVLPYDAHWPELFKTEAYLIEQIFSEIFIDIHHIGSTSIPGLAAKPTIDILLVVTDIEKADHFNGAMLALGYEAWGEYHIPGRRFFLKGEEKRTHHVHAFSQNSPHIRRHLVFRDYLIAHPDIAGEYETLKLKLAQRYRHNRRAYVLNKKNFVKETEAKAINWAKKMNTHD